MNKKGFSIAEVSVSILLVGLLAMATMPIVTQISQSEKGINQNAIDCINTNTIVENASGVITMPASGVCRTTVLDCQFKKGKALNTVVFYADSTKVTAAQNLSAQKILRTACDQGGTKACDYFTNKCNQLGSLTTPFCDLGTFYDITYYLKLPATSLNKAFNSLLPSLVKYYNNANAIIKAEVNNDCALVPGSFACLLRSPATLIRNCNNYDGASCDEAYTYNFNRTCNQIKTAWPGAPDGNYVLTLSTGSSYNTNCDMSSDGGGWTQVANNDGTMSFTSSSFTFGYGGVTNWVQGADRFVDYASPIMRINMGSLRDFFRPNENTFKAMVSTINNSPGATPLPAQKWANDYNNPFVIPLAYFWNLGGSAQYWPFYNVPGDTRNYLSLWGGHSETGGCCYDSSGSYARWYLPFTMWVKEGITEKKGTDCNDTQSKFTNTSLAPSGKYVMTNGSTAMCGMSKHKSCLDWKNAGYTTDGTYWINPTLSAGQQFPTICDMTTDGGGWTQVANNDGTMSFAPSTYSFGYGGTINWSHPVTRFDWLSSPTMRIKMGAVTDFYKPNTGETFSSMAQSQYKHKWSSIPTDPFVIPAYHTNPVGSGGGSMPDWPGNNIPSNLGRRYISWWGYSGGLGGCCAESYADPDPGNWLRPFTMWVKEGITEKKGTDCNDTQSKFTNTSLAPAGKYVMTNGSTAMCGMSKHKSCLNWENAGYTTDGTYWINPTLPAGQQFPTICDMTTGGGG